MPDTGTQNTTGRTGRPPAITNVAEAIKRHLSRGGYAPGDRYLPVRQISKRFGVSLVTAHKAIRLLDEEGLLSVRVGSGAYVARVPPPLATAQQPQTRIVRLFMADEPSLRRRINESGLEDGIRESIPDAAIQLHLLSMPDVIGYLSQVVDAQNNHVLGNILIRVTRLVRQFFSRRTRNTIVLGQTEPDVPLPSVGRDQAAIGKDVAELLLKRSHKHIGLLMLNDWGVGDNLLVDAMQQTIAAYKRLHVRLSIQSTLDEQAMIEDAASRMLQGNDRPTAMVCRSDDIALVVAKVAQRLKLRPGHRLSIISVGPNDKRLAEHAPSIAAMSNDDFANGVAAGRMLLDVHAGKAAHAARVELQSKVIERQSL